MGAAAAGRADRRAGRRPARRATCSATTRPPPRERRGRGEAAIAEPGALDRTVHLSFGDHPGAEYAMQLAADHLVHAVDLARALGLDETVDAAAAAAIETGSADGGDVPQRWG